MDDGGTLGYIPRTPAKLEIGEEKSRRLRALHSSIKGRVNLEDIDEASFLLTFPLMRKIESMRFETDSMSVYLQ